MCACVHVCMRLYTHDVHCYWVQRIAMAGGLASYVDPEFVCAVHAGKPADLLTFDLNTFREGGDCPSQEVYAKASTRTGGPLHSAGAAKHAQPRRPDLPLPAQPRRPDLPLPIPFCSADLLLYVGRDRRRPATASRAMGLWRHLLPPPMANF